MVSKLKKLTKFRARSISKNPGERSNSLFSRLMFFLVGIGLLIGGAYGTSYFLQNFYMYIKARNWQKVPCNILESRVIEYAGDDGPTYRVYLKYEYHINGLAYISERYDFLGLSSSCYASKRKVVDENPPGTVRECYVNPENFSQAVFNRDFQLEFFLVIIPLSCLIISIFGFFKYLSELKDKLSGEIPIAQSLDISYIPEKNKIKWKPDIVSSDKNPEILIPTQSPTPWFVGLFITALIWNTITFYYLLDVIESIKHNPWYIIPVLLWLPFGLAGLGVLVGAFYYLMAMFNPNPRLVIRRRQIHLGEPIELSWRMTGATYFVKEFKITLIGIEEALFEVGSTTATSTNEFFKKVLFHSRIEKEFKDGSLTWKVPRTLIHSFIAPNNRVLWKLKIYGDIPWWPDIDLEFNIDFLPERLAS